MASIFHTLADLLRKSTTKQKDFTIDYEKLLRHADCADGDARELAEKQLLIGETESNGALRIERHKKSAIPEKIRISLTAGEPWLFSKIGHPTPTQEREEIAGFFEQASSREIPEKWRGPWKAWCISLAVRAREGASVQPFSKTDSEELMTALTGVLNWQGESLIRYASARICGDSKQLQFFEKRILKATTAITGETSLEAFGILHKPRTVTFHGPLVLKNGNGTGDFSKLPGPISLSETNLHGIPVSTSATICLTVENEDVFIELAKRNPGILLIQTSFPCSATRRLISLLPEMTFLHFGDSDPAGFDILRDLRERTGRNFQPILMHHCPSPEPIAFSKKEIETLRRLIANPSMQDLRDELEIILHSNDKGLFEQERIPIETVLGFLKRGTVVPFFNRRSPKKHSSVLAGWIEAENYEALMIGIVP